MLLFLPIMLRCSALKIHLLCLMLCSRTRVVVGYVAIYVKFCMSNSLHVADNFIKTVLLKCFNERYQSILPYSGNFSRTISFRCFRGFHNYLEN